MNKVDQKNSLYNDEDIISLNLSEGTQKIVWDQTGFAFSGPNEKRPTIKIIDEKKASSEWVSNQNAALDEYLEAHVNEKISSVTAAHYKLFGAYIGNTLHEPGEKQQPNILDIGCGIGRNLPLYIRTLHHDVNYNGLDAIDVHMRRDYSFICSRLETMMKVPEFENKFDIFIFGTSLDHFEDLDEVARTVKYLAAPMAKVVFWIGLHDIPLAASEEGASCFAQVFKDDGFLKIIVRMFGFAFWSFPRVALALLLNHLRLKRRKKTDDFHFWYFRESDLPEVLSRFGEITDITYIPGGGSVFAICEVSALGKGTK